MGRRGVATGAVLAALLCAPPAGAATLADQTISNAGQVVTWHGASTDPTGQGYGPPSEQTCTPMTCDSFLLHVDLPAGTFPKGPRQPDLPGITPVQAERTGQPGGGVPARGQWPPDLD